MEYKCNSCNKDYKSYQSLWNHNKKFHNNTCQYMSNNCQHVSNNCQTIVKKISCEKCNKIFNTRQARWSHEKKCKIDNTEIDKLKESNKQKELELQLAKEEKEILKLKLNAQKELAKEEKEILKLKLDAQTELLLKEENKKLKEELKNINLTKMKEDIDDIKNNINNPPINNQLINIISDKNKKIEELNKTQQIIQPVIEKQINTFESLTLNNIVITSRSDDNFINATQLCQAGGKLFADWYRLNTTKQLINEAVSDMGIPISGADSLIEINKGGYNKYNQETWIHPDLAIQLAQWLSPKFALQVSKWIRQLFTDGKVKINTKLVSDNKLKDQEIKLLKDTYLKKHKRKDYPDKNVIYILSTVDHLKNRIYIVGKAKNLKNRLSTYNKTCDHQVIYYKKCINEETLTLVESMILNKLKQYQEKANRDRFILPIENDISLFTNIVENCIHFYDGY